MADEIWEQRGTRTTMFQSPLEDENTNKISQQLDSHGVEVDMTPEQFARRFNIGGPRATMTDDKGEQIAEGLDRFLSEENKYEMLRHTPDDDTFIERQGNIKITASEGEAELISKKFIDDAVHDIAQETEMTEQEAEQFIQTQGREILMPDGTGELGEEPSMIEHFLFHPWLAGAQLYEGAASTLEAGGRLATGALELVGIDTPEFFEDAIEYYGNVDEKNRFVGRLREIQQHRLLDAQEAGTGQYVFEQLTQTGTQLATLMAQMKTLNAPFSGKGIGPTTGTEGIKANLKHFGKMASHGFLTTPGDMEDRTRAAQMRLAYNLTPFVASSIPGAEGIKATFADFGLNALLTSPTYHEAYQEAGGLNEDFLSVAIPQMATDLGMAWSTKDLAPERLDLNQYRDDMSKLIRKRYGVDMSGEKSVELLREMQDIARKVDRGEIAVGREERNLEDVYEMTPEMAREMERLSGLVPEEGARLDDYIGAVTRLEDQRYFYERALRDYGDEYTDQERADVREKIDQLRRRERELADDFARKYDEDSLREELMQVSTDDGEIAINKSSKKALETLFSLSEEVRMDLEDIDARVDMLEAPQLLRVEPGGDTRDFDRELPYVEGVSRKEIEDYIRVDMELPLRFGGVPPDKGDAYYDAETGVVRLRNAADMELMAQKVGEQLLERYDIDYTRFEEELIDVARKRGISRELEGEEMLRKSAELVMEDWIYRRTAEARDEAPLFMAEVEDRMTDEYRTKIEDMRDMFFNWEKQGAIERWRGSITKEETMTPDILSKPEKFIQHMVDDAKIMEKSLEKAGVDLGKLSITENPIDLYRLYRGGIDHKIASFINKTPLSPELKPTGKPLMDILEPVERYLGYDDRVGEFDYYITGKHAIEREARFLERELRESDPEVAKHIDDAIQKKDHETLVEVLQRRVDDNVGPATGIRIDDMDTIRERLEELEREHPEFLQALEELSEYRTNLLDYATKRGMLGEEEAERIKESYEYTVPLYRIFEEDPDYFEGTPGKDKMANLPDEVKPVEGSGRPIFDPLTGFVRDTVYMVKQADKNEIMLNFVDAMRKKGDSPAGEILEPVGRSQADEKNIINIRRDGEEEFYRVHPKLHKFFNDDGASPNLGTIGRILDKASSTFAKGAVLAPRFPLRNFFRDEMREALYRDGLLVGEDAYVPLQSFLEGMMGMGDMSKKEVDDLFYAVGGARAGWYSFLDDVENPQSVKEVMTSEGISLNPLDALAKLTRFSEDTRRRGFFRQQLKDVDLNKLDNEEYREQVLEAALHARGGILEDYGIRGETAREVNRFVPFFAANITGWRHFIGKHAEGGPKDTLARGLKGLAIFTLPTIANYIRQRDNETYQELEDWRKTYMNNWVTENGNILSMPVPFQAGLMYQSLPKRVLEAIDREDKQIADELVNNLIDFGLPDPSPLYLLPAAELLANSHWQGFTQGFQGDIVPEHLSGVKPHLQYDEETSEVAKLLGRTLGLSPLQIDHLITGSMSSLGQDLLNTFDLLMGGQDFMEWIGATTGLYNEQLSNPASVRRVYTALDDLENIERTMSHELEDLGLPEDFLTFHPGDVSKDLAKYEVLSDTANALNEMNQERTEIWHMKKRLDETGKTQLPDGTTRKELEELMEEILMQQITLSRRTLQDLEIREYPYLEE